jgi:beta-lactam-binding protein with PASTA domain/predicted Ser/Thr protein kinase
MSVIESTIEGRYQVITRIAAGGMGEVYRAHDAVLGREVAVKVLHSNLAGDRGFVDRFRREARAAAILNHPNIVGVYDWGVSDGTYYMVMEYVPGMNLRMLLRQYRRLEAVQVVEVWLQVLSALDHAHGHGIVHRDIKPENILIGQDGRLKVADFGLARAYADSYVSQVEGTVTGTVQYLSPEQIQGRPADPRTDLYATGVVAYELLTGRPPFTGETSLSIAYQHLSGRVPPPSNLARGVPAELDRAVLHATEKDADARPASARAFHTEVARAGSVAPPAPPIAELAAQVPTAEKASEDRAPTVTIPRAETPRARRARRMRLAAWLAVVVVILGAGAWAAWTYVVPHYTTVPRLVGLEQSVAEGRLRHAGLGWTTVQQFSHDVPSGSVVATDPKVGTRLRTRTDVRLIVSTGPDLRPVPDVAGKTQSRASELLTQAGFDPVVREQFDETVPKGRVISQNPDPQTKLEKDSRVTIVVSNGPAPVEVPPVTGQSAADATNTLLALGFKVKTTEEFSSSVPRNDVIRTEPSAGTEAPKGSTVTIVVSRGPKTFQMPDVVGMRTEDAVAKLEGMGLNVVIAPLPNSDPPDTVVFQSPPAGSTVKQGDTVTIYVTAK